MPIILKGGIVYADAVTTVSETYAEEIKTPFYGETSGWSDVELVPIVCAVS